MRVLAITKVFPNRVVPHAEPHVCQRYASLQGRCDINVLATIPWYPGASLLRRWSYAGRIATAPRDEVIRGLAVRHPRYLLVPKLGFALQWFLYGCAILPEVAARRHQVDLIWCTWVYPDGVAALWVGQLLGIPVVVEAIGSDVNIVAQRPAARVLLRHYLPQAAGVIAVSRPLGAELVKIGAAESRVEVIPTGVNRELFAPRDRAAARQRLGRSPTERMILFVGRIERAKGVFELLQAFQEVVTRDPEATLVYIGTGEAQAELAQQATPLGDRVLLAGGRPLPEVSDWLAACDLLSLPSWNEGTPNVILEALSAGRRVVASRVGGIPDVVSSPLLGELIPARDVPALAAALVAALATPYDPMAVSQASGVLGLDAVAQRLHDSLQRAVDHFQPPQHGPATWLPRRR